MNRSRSLSCSLRIAVMLVVFGVLPASAASFFDKDKSSTRMEAQVFELESWLTSNIEQAYGKFLAKNTFHIQTRVDLVPISQRMRAINLGKLNAFSPIMAELPPDHKAFLERVATVTFAVTVVDSVSVETREALAALAKGSVPLVEPRKVKITFMTIKPASISLRDVLEGIKWPVTSLFIVLILSFTFLRIAGLEWPHLRDLGSEVSGAVRQAVMSHRKLIRVKPEYRVQAYEIEKALESADASNVYKKISRNPYLTIGVDPLAEVRRLINRLGVNELAQLVSSANEWRAQIVQLIDSDRRYKVQQLLEPKVRQSLALKYCEDQEIKVNVSEVLQALDLIRADRAAKEDSAVTVSWLPSLTLDEEKSFYRQLVKRGQEPKAVELAQANYPIELCFALPSKTLRAVFQQLSLQDKVTLVSIMAEKEAEEFYQRAVVIGSKTDQILRDEVRAARERPTSRGVEESGVRVFVEACRLYLKRQPEEQDEYRDKVTEWVRRIGNEANNAKAA